MNVPRRNYLDKSSPAEMAIQNAIEEVEKCGDNPHLTSIVLGLFDMKNKMSDYIDGVQSNQVMDPMFVNVLAESSVYLVPTYSISDNGLCNGQMTEIKFCKGDKNNPSMPRQEGFVSETLLNVVKLYLESVNKGDFYCGENVVAITRIEEAIMWIKKRKDNRESRGVLGTYQK